MRAPLSSNETSAERPSAEGSEQSADGAKPEDEKRSIDGWRPAIGQMLVGPVPKPKARDAPVRRRRLPSHAHAIAPPTLFFPFGAEPHRQQSTQPLCPLLLRFVIHLVKAQSYVFSTRCRG